jgi:DNA-binding transcriptional LysR family regulator
MEHPDSGPDLRRLRYFVSVAEELSFSRAAERLYISQQPLSAAIQKLERDLGVRLFDRSSRRVALTAAGEALLPRARVAVAAAEDAYAAARNAAKGIAGVLRVGVSHGAHPTAMAILDELTARHPDVEIEISQDATGPLVAELRAHRIDVLVGASVHAAPTLARDLVRLDEAFLVVHPRSVHASRQTVRLGELGGERFVIPRETVAPGYIEALIAMCVEAGFTPTTLASPGLVAPPGVPPEHWVVILNRPAVAIMQLDFEPVFVPLVPPTYFRIELVWRPGGETGLVDSCRSAAAAVGKRERWITVLHGESVDR